MQHPEPMVASCFSWVVGLCGMFGAISGLTVATVVAIGGFIILALMEKQYDEQFSVGLMMTARILGIIIAPVFP